MACECCNYTACHCGEPDANVYRPVTQTRHTKSMKITAYCEWCYAWKCRCGHINRQETCCTGDVICCVKCSRTGQVETVTYGPADPPPDPGEEA